MANFADVFERGVEFVWEEVQERDDGTLCIEDITAQSLSKDRKRRLEQQHIGPYLDLIFRRPNRLQCAITQSTKFVHAFFHENPISSVGVIAMREGIARIVCELSGNKDTVVKLLQQLTRTDCPLFPAGEVSLQNALNVAKRSLRSVPTHSTREVVIIMGSLSTCDPGDINDTINVAAVRVCEHMANESGGWYHVAMDEEHVGELLLSLTIPPPILSNVTSAQMALGFASFDSSHLIVRRTNAGDFKILDGGYACPQCHSLVSECPRRCGTCGLMLVCSSHLAKSFRQMFPLSPFQEMKIQYDEQLHCSACNILFPKTLPVYKCPNCKELYCLECDIYIHQQLHVCPGCPVTSEGWDAHSSQLKQRISSGE